jgi:hypothetical protein
MEMINVLRKVIISIMILTNILIFNSTPTKANTINDCTNKVYNQTYDILSDYEKQQLSIFDVNIVKKQINEIYKDQNRCVIGLTDYQNKVVYISTSNRHYDAERIMLHETGHVIDVEYINGVLVVYGEYSLKPEFIEIFNKEKHSINLYSNEKYFLSNSTEYFAECVAIYHLNGDKLKRLAPKTYEYLDRVINQEIIK